MGKMVSGGGNTKRPSSDGIRGEAPKGVIIAAIVLLFLALGVGAFYAYNGGWQTQGQLEDKYKHETGPLIAASHGDTDWLERENAERKKNGQPLLEVPKDRNQKAEDSKAKMAEFQRKIDERRAAGAGGASSQ